MKDVLKAKKESIVLDSILIIGVASIDVYVIFGHLKIKIIHIVHKSIFSMHI